MLLLRRCFLLVVRASQNFTDQVRPKLYISFCWTDPGCFISTQNLKILNCISLAMYHLLGAVAWGLHSSIYVRLLRDHSSHNAKYIFLWLRCVVCYSNHMTGCLLGHVVQSGDLAHKRKWSYQSAELQLSLCLLWKNAM